MPLLLTWLSITTIPFLLCLTLSPLKSQTVSFIYSAPWYTSELHQLKTTGHHLEQLFTKTGLVVTCFVKSFLSTPPPIMHRLSVIKNKHENFTTINNLIKLCDTHSTEQCSAFLKFFNSQIDTIYKQLTSSAYVPGKISWIDTLCQLPYYRSSSLYILIMFLS